jgi:O-antigen ligase
LRRSAFASGSTDAPEHSPDCGAVMFSRLKGFRFGALDYRKIDLRSIAEPIAVVSPIALIVSAQEAVMTTLSLLFLLQSWRSRDFSWARQGWFAALLILWIYSVARTVADHPTATGVLQALQWIHLPLYAAALATWILPDEKARNRLLLAATATLTFYALDCLLQYFLGIDIIGRRIWESRLTSVFGKPGVGIEIAWLMLPPLLGLWQMSYRAFAVIFGFLCSVAVLLSGDRMGLLIVVGYAFAMALLAPRLRKPLLIGLPVACLCLGLLLFFNPALYHRQVETTAQVVGHLAQSHYGIIFNSALDIARDHPFFGVGMHNYQALCAQDRYGPLLVGAEQLPRCPGHPHNVYLEWLVNFGLFGLTLFLVFVALTFRRLFRAVWENREDLVFLGLVASLVLRFLPVGAGTSFFSSWSAEPLFLTLGWSFAVIASRLRVDGEAASRSGLSAQVAHVSHPSSVGV